MKGIEGIYKDLLRLFKDYIISRKEKRFIVKLKEVLTIY